jgi:DNA polymerase-3 subunit epsilon
MREIVFDTETTGLDPAAGHRLVEIGCLELLNAIPTGQVFHRYIDPQRDVPDEAFKVHGLSVAFLTGKPVFGDIAAELVAFLGDARLIAHNAEFDMRFLNAELTAHGYPPVSADRVLDTLALARRRHPGASNSLDALCGRYGIDLSRRTKHGAMLDAELLAEVYAELSGGRQTALVLVSANQASRPRAGVVAEARPEPRSIAVSAAEAEAHARFVQELGPKAVWHQYARP